MIENKLISLLGEKNVLKDEPMKKHTTFKIGGNADFVVLPETAEQVVSVINLAKEENIPLTVLGNGSNVLVGDKGIRGIVMIISKNMSHIEIEGTRVRAGAGVLLSRLANVLYENSLKGFEFASGIPGSLGGAVYMNAGAYGEEMSGVVESVTYIDCENNIKTIPLCECDFGYRRSLFECHGGIVTECALRLDKGDKAEIKAKTDDLRERRVSKQPLDKPSAGSTFKRPEGYFAGALIEQANLKGFKIGGAEISEKHAGFVINNGNATAKDVLEVIEYAKKTVKEKFGVDLEPEIRILGEF
ncbi:MAG: UDP-N-acetylmuramate dehydrogenase [Ruminococcaceae bacterium]|nr:UDP-N-acetylmuramate dehydrogenase [Oscillospiraceae bacterium]